MLALQTKPHEGDERVSGRTTVFERCAPMEAGCLVVVVQSWLLRWRRQHDSSVPPPHDGFDDFFGVKGRGRSADNAVRVQCKDRFVPRVWVDARERDFQPKQVVSGGSGDGASGAKHFDGRSCRAESSKGRSKVVVVRGGGGGGGVVGCPTVESDAVGTDDQDGAVEDGGGGGGRW